MGILPTNRSRFSRFFLVFAGLALFVFTWGLQYKVSLYDPPQATSHSIPQAKLLSEDEQALVMDGATVSDTAEPAAVALSAVVFPFFLAAAAVAVLSKYLTNQDLQCDRSWAALPFASMSAFLFRPPPALS